MKRLMLGLVATLCLMTAGGVAQADEHGGHRRGGLEFDQRYHHDHYYPPRGYVVGGVPGGALTIGYSGVNYYFHGGVWFRPSGRRYVVIAPPFGVVIPLLPPAYVSLWIGGSPYYYANGVYYAPAPGQGYTVVAPPPGADSAQPMAPSTQSRAPMAAVKPPPEPIIYPRNGQSANQTEGDRQECNRWATSQPTALADAEVFQRAVAACMDGRGYSLR